MTNENNSNNDLNTEEPAKDKKYNPRPNEENIKSFNDLKKEVHEKNICGSCGGCVSFCSAHELKALEMAKDDRKRAEAMTKVSKAKVSGKSVKDKKPVSKKPKDNHNTFRRL